MRVNRNSLAAILATAAVIVVVVLGFWKTRGPGMQRLVRADEKRIQNIGQLADQLNFQYMHQNKQLPQGLTEAQKTRFADPVTKKPLEYTPKPPVAYTLCTTFSARSPKEYLDGNFAFWTHSAGPKCFEFDAAQQVPQAPYFYH